MKTTTLPCSLSIVLLLLILQPFTFSPLWGSQHPWKGTFQILSVDSSRFPSIKVLIKHSFPSLKKEDIKIVEGDKEIQAFLLKGSNKDTPLQIKWLSSHPNTQKVHFLIQVGNVTQRGFFGGSNSHTSYYKSSPKAKHTVKLLTTDSSGTHIPCTMVAVHETGTTFEDITSQGGYGLLGTGFAIPPGKLTVELRLISPDISIEHFQIEVKPEEKNVFTRTYGYLKLPYSGFSAATKRSVHIEIERENGRYPSIRSNLQVLNDKLPLYYKTGHIPLPSGTYKVSLLPGTEDSFIKRTVTVVNIPQNGTATVPAQKLEEY